MSIKEIDRYIDDNQRAIIEDIRGLVEIKSYSSDNTKCEEALLYVLNLAEKFGMKTVMGKKRDIGYIEIGDGPEMLSILAHVDVVPEGNISLWNTDPFTLVEKDGILYGRGIQDDKGPVIQTLYAMKYLVDSGKKLNKRIRFIVGTKEEVVWTDIESYKEEFESPDYGYSPDGEFPIFNAENGYMDIELVFRDKLPEELGDFIGGGAHNSIPSEAYFTENGVTRKFEGIASHSSLPELGENAIVKLCNYLAENHGIKLGGFISKYFPEGTYASNLPIEVETEGIPKDAAKGRTTIVPTTMFMENNFVTVNLNCRQAFSIPGRNIVKALDSLKDEYNYEINVTEQQEPIYVPKDEPWLQRMAEAYEAFGLKSEFKLAGGCSYAKAFANCVSWGPIFPGDTDAAHMENEELSVKSMMLGAKIYANYLEFDATEKIVSMKGLCD